MKNNLLKLNKTKLDGKVLPVESKYKVGELVCEKIRPSQTMIVERYTLGVYYCKLQQSPHRKAIAYLEKDLKWGLFITV